MKLKLGKQASLNHYRFASSSTWGFAVTIEDFRPWHNKRSYDFTLSYGKGAVYLEFWKKIKP